LATCRVERAKQQCRYLQYCRLHNQSQYLLHACARFAAAGLANVGDYVRVALQ
jgi:hypothetical protein